MQTAIGEVPKPKEHIKKTEIKLIKQFYEGVSHPDLRIVGFIYKVLTNLQSKRGDLLFNFSSFERTVRVEDEEYALVR